MEKTIGALIRPQLIKLKSGRYRLDFNYGHWAHRNLPAIADYLREVHRVTAFLGNLKSLLPDYAAISEEQEAAVINISILTYLYPESNPQTGYNPQTQEKKNFPHVYSHYCNRWIDFLESLYPECANQNLRGIKPAIDPISPPTPDAAEDAFFKKSLWREDFFENTVDKLIFDHLNSGQHNIYAGTSLENLSKFDLGLYRYVPFLRDYESDRLFILNSQKQKTADFFEIARDVAGLGYYILTDGTLSN